ncbi:hypothetical protein [Accumulibacter sp.]|uniref:hypothetical protein n=1 Tax=Accumulibacter sp. TaxID=2053492 RepID=UPI0035B4E99A
MMPTSPETCPPSAACLAALRPPTTRLAAHDKTHGRRQMHRSCRSRLDVASTVLEESGTRRPLPDA